MSGEDPLLPIEREVIAGLARDDLREEPGPGQPLFDRLWRLVRDGDVPLAAAAGDLDPHVLHDKQRRGPIVELLTDLLADRAAVMAALRAGSLLRWDLVDPTLAGEVGRQRLAAVLPCSSRG